MRAMTIRQYGGPDVLHAEDIEKPTPRARDVLVRVCAAAVNPVDCKIRSGGQRNVIRYAFPWVLGLDVSGVVEAVGADVKRFNVGDEVWSSPTHRRPGSYAEYMCIDEREAARKPKNLSHEEAASMPLVGLTAYQCLVDKGRLKKGQTVLVHAGSGGVGAFAVQLAKHLGATVITTCSAKNADFVRDLGADRVVDYTKESFANAIDAGSVDLVLDSVGEPAYEGNLAVVRRGGRISNITIDLARHVERFGTFFSLFTLAWTLLALYVMPWVRKGIHLRHVIKRCDGAELEAITTLVEQGALRPTIDRVLPLEEVAEAHRLSETHHARGKIVLKVTE
jgi:NADPH:quinone reductase-like Zn-dependent oxidoreductase